MLLNQSFVRSEMPVSSGFDPLPAGWYTATIHSAEVCTTRAGDGEYIKVILAITGPSHQGRMVFGNINIKNRNPKAEEIARQQLGQIMGAIGLESLSDTDQLVGGVLSVKLSVKAETEQYPAGNEIKGFKALEGSAAPMPQSMPQSMPPQKQQEEGSVPVWARQK